MSVFGVFPKIYLFFVSTNDKNVLQAFIFNTWQVYNLF